MNDSIKFKPSRYNIILEEDNKYIAFNSMNCALAKVNEDFLDILRNTSQLLTGGKKELFDNMVQMGFLVDNNVEEIDLLRLRQLKGCFDYDTLTITILPTDACNFSCFYCFEHKKGTHMSRSVQEKTVEFIKSHLTGCKKLKLCWFGGEPLLETNVIWDLSRKILNICNEASCEYSAFMVTNGSLINDDIIDNLQKYKIDTLQITIDGDEKLHNMRRCTQKGEETFHHIMYNMKKLIDKRFNVICRINIDKSNIGSINGLMEYLKNEFADNLSKLQISFGQILPIDRLDEWNTSVCLSDTEYSLYTNDYVDYMIDNGFNIPNMYPFYPTPTANFCGGVQINSFVIRPTGVIDKCWDCESLPVGDVHNGIAYNVFHENNLAKWITWNPFADEECRNCRVLPICMGGCPYFSLIHKRKKCLKWKNDIEESIRRKYRRYIIGK